MPETTEIAEQVTESGITVPFSAGVVINALAIYGATCLVMDTKRKITSIRANRKARKAVESEPTPEA